MCPSDSPRTDRVLRLHPQPLSAPMTATAAASLCIPPRGDGSAAMGPVCPYARPRTRSPTPTTTSARSPVRSPATQQAGQSACPCARSHTCPAAPAATHPPAHLLHALRGARMVLERTAGGALLDGVFGVLRGCGVAVDRDTDRCRLAHPRLYAGRAARAATGLILLQAEDRFVIPGPPMQPLAAAPARSACYPARPLSHPLVTLPACWTRRPCTALNISSHRGRGCPPTRPSPSYKLPAVALPHASLTSLLTPGLLMHALICLSKRDCQQNGMYLFSHRFLVY